MRKYALAAGLLLLLGACRQGTEVVSPDGENKLVLSLDESGALSYRIWSGDKEIVQQSSLGLEAEEAEYSFVRGLTYVSASR